MPLGQTVNKTKSDLKGLGELVLNLLLWVCLLFAISEAVNKLNVSILFISIAALIIAAITRGQKILNDITVFFVVLFGIVPLFGWVFLPDFFNPVIAAVAIWILICIRYPTRSLRAASTALCAPAVGFLVTFFYWKDFSKGDSVTVLSRLFPVWDTSAHFYFFLLNLEYGVFIPRIPNPIDGGMNEWSGVEYPTGVHYLWSRFVGASSETFLDSPILATPFFATAIVLTLALSVTVVVIAFVRMGVIKGHPTAVGVVSIGIALATVGLGIFSQTISSGFVNISVVVALGALLVSHVVKPMSSLNQNDFIVLSCILGISYNWYPVLLFFTPALLIYFFLRLRRNGAWHKIRIVSIWFVAAMLAVLPVMQTFTLGVDHLSQNGGVGRLSPNLSIMALLISTAFLIMVWSRLSLQNRLLLMAPGVVNLSFALYFRITDGDYRYYFQKINMFSVVLNVFIVIALTIYLWAQTDSVSRHTNRVKSFVISLIGTLALVQVFGYLGPDPTKFAADGSLSGLVQRKHRLSSTEQNLRTARIIKSAAEQVIDLPLRERSWIMLALPNRITRLGGVDGSHIILSNVWLHSLTKSQTLTGFRTAYVAVNLEVRGALANDRSIANEMPKIFQPDSVTVYSTKQVVSFLKSQPYAWKTITFDESFASD